MAGPGQAVDESGQIIPDLGDVQYVDRDGKQQIRVDGTSLQIGTGSPKRLEARVKPADIQEVAAEAEAATSELDARTTALLLDHEIRLRALEGWSRHFMVMGA